MKYVFYFVAVCVAAVSVTIHHGLYFTMFFFCLMHNMTYISIFSQTHLSRTNIAWISIDDLTLFAHFHSLTPLETKDLYILYTKLYILIKVCSHLLSQSVSHYYLKFNFFLAFTFQLFVLLLTP